MQQEPDRSQRLRARLALAALVLMVGGVVAFGWYFWDASQPAVGDVIKLEPGDQPGGGAGGGFRRALAMAQAEGVRPGIGNAFTVRGGDAHLAVRYPDEGEPRYALTYRNPPQVEGDARTLITAHTRLVQSNSFARSIGVSPEQVAKLKKLRTVRHNYLHAQPADLERLRELADAVSKSSQSRRQQAEQALVAAVREIGAARVEPTRHYLIDLGSAIAEILTPEQVMRCKQIAAAELPN